MTDQDRPKDLDEDRVRRALHTASDAADAAHGAPVADGDDLGRRIRTRATRRTRVAAAAAAAVVVAAGVGSFVVGRSTADGSGTTPMAATANADVDGGGGARSDRTEDAAAPIGAPVSGAGREAAAAGGGVAADSSPAGGGGGPADPLFTRTADDGTVLDVRRSRATYRSGADIPFWEAPGWCWASGQFYVGVRSPEAVGQLHAERYDAVRPGALTVTGTVVGVPEGAPRWVVLVQAPGSAVAVRATFPDGRTDAAEVHDGTAVLTAALREGFAAEPDGTTGDELRLEGVDSAGTVVASWAGPRWGGWADEGLIDTGAAEVPPSAAVTEPSHAPWSDPACQPPTALPEPGAQPADPAAAEGSVRQAWETAVAGAELDDGALGAVIDDPSGISGARADLRRSSLWTMVAGARLPIDAVVFVDPTTAYFRYSIYLGDDDVAYYEGRFGEARAVDGTWKVTRRSVCSTLELAGVDCGG